MKSVRSSPSPRTAWIRSNVPSWNLACMSSAHLFLRPMDYFSYEVLTVDKSYEIFGAWSREINMRSRKDDMIKPPHLTNEQWLASLLSNKVDILRQIRREVHTRGNQHQKYVTRLERAIVRATAGEP
jgi:hypothetical protein